MYWYIVIDVIEKQCCELGFVWKVEDFSSGWYLWSNFEGPYYSSRELTRYPVTDHRI